MAADGQWGTGTLGTTTPMLPSKSSPSSASSGFLDPYYDNISSNSQALTAPFSTTAAAATALNGPSSFPSALRPTFSSPQPVSSAASSSSPFVAGAGAPPFSFSSSSSLPSGAMSSSFDLSSFKGEPGGGDGLADNLRAMSLTGQGQSRYSALPTMMGMPPRSAVPPSYLPPASAPSFGRPAAAASMAYSVAGGGSAVSPSLFVPSPPDPMMVGAGMQTMSSRSLGAAMQSMSEAAPPPSGPSSNGFFAPVPISTVGSVTDRDLNEEDPASAGAPFVYFSAQKIPTQKKMANIGSLPFGALISPVKEVDGARPPVLTRNPVRCEMCGAHVNLYCKVAPRIGQWTCVFCTHTNSCSGNYSVDDFGSWPELVVKTVDYAISSPRSGGYSAVASGVAPAPAPSSAILLIDENLSDPYMEELQKSLFGVLEKMPEDTRVGIVTFGAAVSVYDLSEPGVASADVLPGSSSPTEEAIKILLYGSGCFLSPIHSCAPIAHSIVSSLRAYRGKAVECERKRCLGAAVEVALALVRGPMVGEEESSIRNRGEMGLSRILVCTSGPPNYGPGAAPVNEEHPNYAYEEANAKTYMETLGKEAKYLDVAVDILCAGSCPVKVPVLHLLAKASGGLLWLHDDFGDTFGANLQRAVTRVCGTDGVLEVRCSGPVAITRIIGPAEAITDSQEESFPEDIVTSCCMSSVEENQGFVLCMELRDDVAQDHVHFQFVARYVNLERERVVRVITLRLPTTGSASTYLKAVVEDVAAVLIAKRTVVEALTPEDAADMKLSIDERLKDIAVHFGTQVKGSKMRKFPSELHRLPEMLFHLRRGALLGNIVGHEDERAVLRNVFLQASFDLSLRMTVPRLLAHVQGGTFEEVPAVNLALQSDLSLVLDHGTDVFIWMGLDVLADEAKGAGSLAACKTLALEAVENRFPLPRIVVCKEADSKARYVLARLVPAHKDSPFEQDAWFPKLRTLLPEQRAKLKTKFFHTDDPSFFEYMKSLKLMPPEVPSGFR